MTCPKESAPARRIWELDCTALTMVLAHGVPCHMRRELARSNICACCAHLAEDDAWVLQGVHKACHSANTLSETLETYLNRRYAAEVGEVRATTQLELTRRIAQRPFVPSDVIGTVWALVTDPDQEKSSLGQRMVHALLLRGAELSQKEGQFNRLVSKVQEPGAAEQFSSN